jgi:hypothetical protein
MPTNEQGAGVTLGLTRKSLEATVIKACPKCQAPGCYSNAETIRFGWPACYAVARNGESVGAICPQCGEPRPPDVPLGELSASMPRWLWRVILGVKWCIIRYKSFTRRRNNNAA